MCDDYVERLVVPYFTAVAEWYGALHVGQIGGELQSIVDRHWVTTSSASPSTPVTNSTSTSG